MGKILLAAALVFSASAAAQPLASLPVAEEIPLPDKPHFFGSNSGLAGVFGLLGGLLAAPGIEDSRDKIKLYMETHRIDIRQIVLDEYRKAAAAVPAELALPKDGAPHKVKLEIVSYGVSARGPFANEYKPWLRMRLHLLDKGERSAWSDGSFIHNRNDGTPTHPLEKFFGDPEVMRTALTRAAELAAAEVTKKLTEEHAKR